MAMEKESKNGFLLESPLNDDIVKKMRYEIGVFRDFKFKIYVVIALLYVFGAQTSVSQPWDGVIITQADYEALQALKSNLIDPEGVLKSWNDSGYGACSGKWEGIKCAQGQVIVLQLPWRGLGGTISDKIGQFTALRKLSLHDNSIGGMIPSSLGLLPDLRGVQLFNNRFSGSIPPEIGSCPFLQSLDLSNNSLTGFIPSSLANSSKLSRLNLSYNALSGSIPLSLAQSLSLQFLALEHNNLSGPLPSAWGAAAKANSYQLQYLTLDHNLISGSIPIGFGAFSKLQTLDLSNNAISGSFPTSLYNLTSLVKLNLERNRIQSRIPDGVDRLQKLSVLDLKRNQFRGPIPVGIGKISSLTQLDLSQNNFTGNIPSSLVDLTRLSFLNVSYNQLSGSVPFPLTRKFNSSSFVGNLGLCGYSVSTPCPVSPSPPSPKPTRSHGRRLSTKEIILIAAGALLAILLILVCILLCCLIRRRRARAATQAKSTGQAASAGAKEVAAATGAAADVEAAGGEVGGKLVHFDGPFLFTADDLLCATAEIMGKSTYGTVYKATLESGNEVAVKRLREKIAKSQKEFEVEVNKLGKIRHANLLALRAYYLGPKGEKLLVFDFMPRGSLAAFLHARGQDTPINWPTRLNIIIGTARGLNHLHTNEHMIHGNLTTGNILLDENTNAKIADYGLSRLMTAAANSNVIATAAALGYRAPELSKLKKANTKTDVYSLGVVILELLTGKSPGEAMNGEDLPHWVASIVKEEWTNEVFDLELMRDASTIGDELLNTLKLALHCVDPSPTARPEVQQILQQLEEIMPELGASSSDDRAGDASASGEGGVRVPSTSD